MVVALSREARLIATIVTLADTTASGRDLSALLQTLVDGTLELLGGTGAGILLLTPARQLDVVAASAESGPLGEILRMATDCGPAFECVRTGQAASVPDVEARGPWPEFRGAAFAGGFRSIHVLPLRLRENTIGALIVFRGTKAEPDAADLMAAQTLGDIATIGILQERTMREAELTRAHLQHALERRITIEQAKGVIATCRDLDMTAAFTLMHEYARDNQMEIDEVADQVVRRVLTL